MGWGWCLFEVLALLVLLESTCAPGWRLRCVMCKKNDRVGGVDVRRTWCRGFKRCLDDARVGRSERLEVYHIVWGRYSADCHALAACCWHCRKAMISSEPCCEQSSLSKTFTYPGVNLRNSTRARFWSTLSTRTPASKSHRNALCCISSQSSPNRIWQIWQWLVYIGIGRAESENLRDSFNWGTEHQIDVIRGG